VQTNSELGWAVVTTTGLSDGSLSGCVTVFGSGEVISGATVIQNTIKALIAANVRSSVTPDVSANEHGVSAAQAGSYYPLDGPTELDSLSSLTLASFIAGVGFTSGQTKIKDTNGNWHTVGFTGTTTTPVLGDDVTVLTSCTYGGDTTQSIELGSPIVAATSGGPQSILWWLNLVVDPDCPAKF
jgi:hypothetical protein